MGAYKFGFQKEWYHFGRTFRFGGILIALFSVAIANPLMIKAVVAMLGAIGESPTEMMADAAMPDMGLGDLVMEYTSGVVFGAALSDLCNTALLVILLLLMSPFGGEQKKRATLIPSCSGLDNKYYLIPKFVLYPAIIFVTTFFAGILAGLICNAMFPQPVGFGYMLLGSVLCAIYLTFIVVIYMALGLCTSRPGIMTIVIYFGQGLINSILLALGLERFNPFTLYSVFTYQLYDAEFSLGSEAASIIVGIVLSVVIAVMMYFLTLAVLKNKRINNQEDRPEF
ncbi:MAG: hypothetical protein E7478_01670 [Ruminococcaceae bacterium]|nr:hypothetical protein [Oscillospiraceae bacterium]